MPLLAWWQNLEYQFNRLLNKYYFKNSIHIIRHWINSCMDRHSWPDSYRWDRTGRCSRWWCRTGTRSNIDRDLDSCLDSTCYRSDTDSNTPDRTCWQYTPILGPTDRWCWLRSCTSFTEFEFNWIIFFSVDINAFVRSECEYQLGKKGRRKLFCNLEQCFISFKTNSYNFFPRFTQ